MAGFPITTNEGVAKTDFDNLIANLKYNPFINLLANGNMERAWRSDSQCDYWWESGTTNSRSNTQAKFGTYSLKITATGTSDYSYQDLINPAEYKGLSVTAGCWVYAPATNAILRISDGVGSTDSSTNTSTSSWEWIEVTRTIDASATMVRLELRPTDTSGDFYFDGAVLVLGTEAPRSGLPLSMGELIRRLAINAGEPSWTAEMGDEYFDTTDMQKKVYDGSSWRIIG